MCVCVKQSMEVKMPSSDSKVNKKKNIEKRGSWGGTVLLTELPGVQFVSKKQKKNSLF